MLLRQSGLATSLSRRCEDLLVDLGTLSPGEPIEVRPLSGGVASDIAMVSARDKRLCVKFALPKLKVEADWFAPVHRNVAEYAWLTFASKVAPDNAIALYGQSEALHGFAMECIEGDDTYLWKDHLLAEATDNGEASKVGKLISRIQAASTQVEFDSSPFRNPEDFFALRLEPYLIYTAEQHNCINGRMKLLAEELYHSRQVLVHGDVSPKNIFFREGKPILLDAECASMGDASFDPAFCLNHLVLKAIHLPNSTEHYLYNASEFWKHYCPNVTWEPCIAIESRVCRLLPALMLARVDGKSPVEYLSEQQSEIVRQIALRFIRSPVDRLSKLLEGIHHFIMDDTT